MRRLPRLVAVMAALAAVAGCASAAESRSPRICGWFDNPSPGNASLWDKDGEWTIAIQGDFEARGDWPGPFGGARWVSSGNASYGRGCACLTGQFDGAARRVLRIDSSQVKPLRACRHDPALKQYAGRFE